MKNLHRISALALALAIGLTLSLSGLTAAEGTGFTDVPAGAWYTGAVEFAVREGLMSGTGDGLFRPEENTSRAMLVTILWKLADAPVVNYLMHFPDVPGGEWYTEAVRWAASERIVSGYDDGRFGTDDPVTREQLVTILWQYRNRPAAGPGEDFADEASISPYAAAAVDWSRSSGLVSGREGNRFDPQGHATRAETAAIFQNLLALEDVSEPDPAPGSRTLVVYYSATGSTRRAAEYIAGARNADTFELVPVRPYTSADLSWTTPGSRVNQEHDDESLRRVALTANTVDNWADYDTIFIGYPIWWGIAAWPVNDFIQNNDFTGKTVIPFCTSSSSGLGQSGTLLAQMAGTGNWLEGRRFSSRASQSEVTTWAAGLELG